MALTRSEIEILIKARNEAQGAFDNLSKQVGAVTGNAAQATTQLERTGKATKEVGNAGQGAAVAFGLLAERLARGLVGAFGDTIREANKLDSGLIGLSSVAKAFGADVDAAQAAARSLAADGLMSVGDAATSLKNLLAAGFGLDQAVELMNRFKDSAAFGRQGALSFGEAIRGATEGIKNGNSILVDNAGVTKNLSQMLTEAGFSAQDLSKASSDVNVRMAIFNGILKETNPQLGDAAKYAETAAGGQAKFNSQIDIAQAKIGKALQPALASTLSIMTPMVQVIGDNADVFLALGGILGTLVIPKAAAMAAQALGLTGTLSGMASTTKLALSVFQGVRSLTDFRAGIQLAGEAAGLTTAKLGKLGTAASIAGAAFIGWEIGKIIDQFTGLSGAVERATVKIMGWSDTAAVAGAKQDVINRAISFGAAATITYTDAIKFNEQVLAVRVATFDKSAEAQRRGIDAELALGRITLETANARKAALDAELQAQDVQGRRVKLTDAITNAERAYHAEIKATGYTQAELVKTLRDNEAGFDAWAKQVNLSDATIKRLKDSLKGADEGHKQHQKALEDSAKATEKLRDDLFSLGVVTTETGKKALDDLIKPLTVAGNTTTPAFRAALVKVLPELEALAKKAAASGVQVAGLNEAMARSKGAADSQIAAMMAWEDSLPTVALEDLIRGTQTWTAEQEWAGVQTRATADAFRFFGITTRTELQTTAAEAERHYRQIVQAIGANAPEAKAAYREMIDAQKAATQEIPSIWQSDIFPKVKGVIGNLTDAINGSFAQMLLGAKGFKDGFVDIWNSIKSAVGNILNSILSTFLNTFLKGILGAMNGQKGAISSAFSGMFNMGGTGGGGGLLGGLGSLFGGGGAGGGLSAGSGGLAAGLPGAGSVGGGAAGGAGLGILGGGLAAGAAGFGLGKLFQNVFGGAGLAAGGTGALSGAATGALIGSIVPGLGTLIGGVIGGLGGLLGGLLGKSVGEKTNDIRDQFFAQFGGGGTGQGSGFNTVAAELAKLSAASGGGEGGGKLFQDLIKADSIKEFEAAVRAVEAALKGTEYATIKVREATDALTVQRNAAVEAGKAEDDVLKEQAVSYSALLQTILTTGATAPDALRPILERLIEMGELVDGNGNKITDLGAVKFPDAAAQIHDGLGLVDAGIEQSGKKWDDYAKRGGVVGRKIIEGLEDLPFFAERAADGIENAFDGVAINIPVKYEVPDMPGLPGPSPDIPGAAAGVVARQPGLVVFGEGGETEVGGPASFFRNIFESLAGSGPATSAAAPVTIGPFNITAMSGADLKTAIERDVIPPILDALRINRRGSLTDMKTILGVS